MPRTHRSKPLYQRGDYRLYPREGRNLEIVRYDPERKRERVSSAGTADLEAGRTALDRKYLKATGGEYAPPVVRTRPLVTSIIADYQLAHGDQAASADAIRHRLSHVVSYIATLPEKATICESIDEQWLTKFRAWLAKQPIRGSRRERSPATIENSVLQLGAAMRWAKQIPAFKPIPLPDVTRSPTFRATIPQLAAMFRYAMETPRRANLLAFLRLSVATWGRPDAVLDASTDPRRGQWASQARAFNLNPVGRRQTKKRRPLVPVPECIGAWLDTVTGAVVPDQLSKSTWRRMEVALGFPGQGESGMKCVRRSIATLARPLIGERDWDSQGEMMLGHRPASTSDIYALPDPAHFGVALAATQRLIDQIDKLAPGAFYFNFAARDDNVVSIAGRKNG